MPAFGSPWILPRTNPVSTGHWIAPVCALVPSFRICPSPPPNNNTTPRGGVIVWLWATKKIFSAVLRMNSNPCINEILADARVKSANADEIFGFASDEIKSTHPPSRRISPNEVGFHRRRRFHPPARVDLVEKSTDKVDAFFWRRRRDSNPCDAFTPYEISSFLE